MSRRCFGATLAGVLLAAGCEGDDRESAGLAFTRYTSAEHSDVWVADADGSHALKLVEDAYGAAISPDGRRVAYLVPNKDRDAFPILHVRTVSGEDSRSIGPAIAYEWSSDGRKLAVSDRTKLFAVDVGSGARQVVATGAIFDFSFAPDDRALAYGRWNDKVGRESRSDVFVVRLADGRTRQLTDDGHSDEPVWGREWIVYRRFRFDGDWSIGRLWLMRPDGSERRFLAQGDERVGHAKMGLRPLEVSQDATRLLACAAAEFYCAPVTLTVPGGRRSRLGIEGNRALVRQGELPHAGDLSSDGRELLFDVSDFDSARSGRIYAIPFDGGEARLIVPDAVGGSWAD